MSCLDPYGIDDFDRTNHHKIMKQISQESLEPVENVDASKIVA